MSALLDWGLATRIAEAAAGDGPAAMAGELDLAGAGRRSREAVLAYTRLEPSESIPEPEWVSRRDWARINLESMRGLIGELEGRIEGSLPEGRMGEMTTAIAGRVLAVQVGGLVGLASRRVLGQYEFPLLGGERAPRLVFVGHNLDEAAGELDSQPADLLEWVARHEVTHAVHFSAAPWLRDHLGAMASELVASAPPQLSVVDLAGAARRFASSDPRRLVEELRESDPVTLLAPPASRPTIAAVQSTMAAIEGYAEHVMDAAGSPGPEVERLRAGLERRRANRGALARALAWLLGFEMKLRQYRDGKRFADAVVAGDGIEALNRAWEGPAKLPSLVELGAPELWLGRVRTSPPA